MATIRALKTKTLSEYKRKILEAIVGDQMLIRAIHNNGENALYVPVENPADLIYKKIFPWKHTTTDVPEEKETYVSMTFTAETSNGKVFSNVFVGIYIICHKDIMRIQTPEGYQVRSDYIMERLEYLLDDSLAFGVGRLNLRDIGEMFVSIYQPGFYMNFTSVDNGIFSDEDEFNTELDEGS